MSSIIIKISLVYILVIFAYGKVLSAEIEITSQTMEWKREENIAIASGEAKAIQGNRILNAEKIIVFFNKKEDKKNIYKLDASGNVRFISGSQIATGEFASYFVDDEKVIIKGNVRLKRDDSLMIGEELSIDLKNSSSKLISGNNSGKVKVKYKTEDKQ